MACSGVHGANRLGGNSLSDLLVFGNLSGRGASKYAKELSGMPQFRDDDVKTSYDHFKKYFLGSLFYSNSTIIRKEIIKKSTTNRFL